MKGFISCSWRESNFSIPKKLMVFIPYELEILCLNINPKKFLHVGTRKLLPLFLRIENMEIMQMIINIGMGN